MSKDESFASDLVAVRDEDNGTISASVTLPIDAWERLTDYFRHAYESHGSFRPTLHQRIELLMEEQVDHWDVMSDGERHAACTKLAVAPEASSSPD